MVVGLLFFLAGLERRARQRVTRPSEVAVGVDTSQSMSLPQSDQPGSPSRMEAATELIAETPMISALAKDHRVTLYTFDTTGELNEVLVSNLGEGETKRAEVELQSNGTSELDSAATESLARPVAIIGAIGLATSVLLMLVAGVLAISRTVRAVPPLLLASALLMVVGGGMLGTVWTIHTDRSLKGLVGLGETVLPSDALTDADKPGGQDANGPNANGPDGRGTDGDQPLTLEQRMAAMDWESTLVAAGGETRIGDALRSVSSRHDPTTLAGVMLLTDGENNGGTPPLAAAALIARGGTAIYPIGFGSAKAPTNVRIVDLDAPRRVYPGDKFGMNAVLQASGNGPMTVQVQLLDNADSGTEAGATADDGAGSDAGELVDSREVTIPGDGTLTGVRAGRFHLKRVQRL